jgi:DNA-binding NarL/FixJ family response regulator
MNILLVDDDLILQSLLKHHLNNLGLENIQTAQSGEEAIALAEKNEFNVGFFDINLLTDLDGIDTAHKIRELQPNIQVVFISANEDSKLMERVSNIENLGFLNKPYNPELIEQYIKMVKMRIRQMNRNKS